MSDDIGMDVDAGIATILLNRPARRNAFTFDMLDLWAEYLRSVRRDPAVRVVVIRGPAGRSARVSTSTNSPLRDRPAG